MVSENENPEPEQPTEPENKPEPKDKSPVHIVLYVVGVLALFMASSQLLKLSWETGTSADASPVWFGVFMFAALAWLFSLVHLFKIGAMLGRMLTGE